MKRPVVNLTTWEYGEALREAHYRHSNWKGGHSYQHHNQRDANILGVVGEAAAGKYLGLSYVRGTDWQPYMADLGEDIEVKTSQIPVLILQGNNNRDRRYLLVRKDPKRGYHFIMQGWAYGWEVFQDGVLHPAGSPRGGKHGSYWLDVEMLHDAEELRASVLFS